MKANCQFLIIDWEKQACFACEIYCMKKFQQRIRSHETANSLEIKSCGDAGGLGFSHCPGQEPRKGPSKGPGRLPQGSLSGRSACQLWKTEQNRTWKPLFFTLYNSFVLINIYWWTLYVREVRIFNYKDE